MNCPCFHSEIQAGRLTAFKMKNILDTGVGWVAVTYLIWRDPTGQLLVFDSQSGIHAERAFTNYLDTNGITPDRVNSFWLSNSPCSDCASELINFFTPTGPASQKIYVGNIYKGGRSINIQQTNREGLERLYEFGFGFDNWDWQLFCNFLINIQFDPTVVEVIQNYISANPPFNNAAYRARDQQTVTCLREVARGCYGQCLFGNRHQYPTC